MTAHEITNRLMLEIPKRFGFPVWRQNVVATKIGDRLIRAGLPGMADLSGIGPSGVRVEIEVKAGKDRLSPQQASWGRMIESHGGIFLVAHDVEKTLIDLKFKIDSRANAGAPR
jgi:hypothetical protein